MRGSLKVRMSVERQDAEHLPPRRLGVAVGLDIGADDAVWSLREVHASVVRHVVGDEGEPHLARGRRGSMPGVVGGENRPSHPGAEAEGRGRCQRE